jgi:hypothetical protein
MLIFVFITIWLLLLLQILSIPRNDYVVLDIPILYSVGNINKTASFRLYYSKIRQWELEIISFCESIGVSVEIMTQQVLLLLAEHKYSPHLLQPGLLPGEERTTSKDALKLSLISALKYKELHDELFIVDPSMNSAREDSCDQCHISSCVADDCEQMVLQPLLRKSLFPNKNWVGFNNKIPRHLLHHSPRFILYQTVGAHTGGTAAVLTLYHTLLDLGFPTLLCNETNRYFLGCTRPSGFYFKADYFCSQKCNLFTEVHIIHTLDDQVVITGEWCHEVLDEYVLHPFDDIFSDSHGRTTFIDTYSSHNGRGIQYYLGFHHAPDSCR